jgi:hypothetical protein
LEAAGSKQVFPTFDDVLNGACSRGICKSRRQELNKSNANLWQCWAFMLHTPNAGKKQISAGKFQAAHQAKTSKQNMLLSLLQHVCSLCCAAHTAREL